MCVAVLRFRPATEVPVVVGFNRDEDPARDAGLPAVFLHRGRRIQAAREPLHGGTWLGVSETGLVVGLLNRQADRVEAPEHGVGDPTVKVPDPMFRSRGLLVLDALARPDVAGVERLLGELRDRYQPFNLFATDAAAALAAHSDGGPVAVWPLKPGLYVFAHGDVNDRANPRTARVRSACLGQRLRTAEEWITALRSCLAGHAADPSSDASPCRHGAGHQTLCSTILVGDPGAPGRMHYFHAPGPPCVTAYQEVAVMDGGTPAGGAGGRSGRS